MKKDLVAALVALPEYSGRKAELERKKSKADLKKLWQEKQAAPAATVNSGDSGNDSIPTGA